MDRHAIAQAVAKVLAYAGCGKKQEANEWLEKLIVMLRQAIGD